MQLSRLVPALGLLFILGAFGSVVGCGSKSQQVELDKEDENGMLVARKGIRTFNKQLRESANANSNHPGGANFLFADGSVHFVKSSISVKAYWALGTKAGGEIISSDSY